MSDPVKKVPTATFEGVQPQSFILQSNPKKQEHVVEAIIDGKPQPVRLIGYRNGNNFDITDFSLGRTQYSLGGARTLAGDSDGLVIIENGGNNANAVSNTMNMRLPNARLAAASAAVKLSQGLLPQLSQAGVGEGIKNDMNNVIPPMIPLIRDDGLGAEINR